MNKNEYNKWWSSLSDADKTAYSSGNKQYPREALVYLVNLAKKQAQNAGLSTAEWLNTSTPGKSIKAQMTGPYASQVLSSIAGGKYVPKSQAPRPGQPGFPSTGGTTGTGSTGGTTGSTTDWSSFLSAGTYKYPSADYLRSHGITDQKLIDAYAGKVITNATTAATALSAIHQHFGTDNTKKIFSDFKNFDPIYASVGTGTQKSKELGKMAQIWDAWKTGGGLENVDASLFNQWAPSASDARLIYEGQTLLANAQASAAKKSSAYQQMQTMLDQMGLGKLSKTVQNLVFKNNVTDPNEIMKVIRQTKDYKNTFPGLVEHNTNPNFPEKLTEMDYLQMAAAFRETARTFGLPQSFFTNKEIGQLIAGGVSRAELNRRLLNGYQVAKNAMDTDPVTAKYLKDQGVDFGHLLAYYLDPAKAEPLITEKTTKAQLQGYAENVGALGFTEDMATELAKRARSNINTDGTYTPAAEQAAIQQAGAASMLTGATPGSGAPTVSTEQLIGSKIAGFGKTDMASAQQAVEQASQAQTAPFRKGGGYAASQEGVTGLGQV